MKGEITEAPEWLLWLTREYFSFSQTQKTDIRCGRQNNASSSKDIHVLIPEPCVYVTLHGKMDFASVIKLRILNRNIVLKRSKVIS